MARRMRHLRRILVVLLLVFVLAAVAIGTWAWHYGGPWLDRTIRARLETAVRQASVDGYHFTMESVVADFRSGDVHIQGIVLRFDSALRDSLRNGVHDYLFAGETRSLELRGLSIWRVILKSEVHIRSIEVDEPVLDYTIGERRIHLQEPFQRLAKPGTKGAPLFKVDRIIVRDAQATMQDLSGHLPVLRASRLNVAVNDLRVSPLRGSHRSDLDVGSLDLAMDSLSTDLPGGYRLRSGSIHLSDQEGKGHVHHVTLQPNAQFDDKVRSTTLNISLDSLVLHGPDIAALIGEKTLHVRELVVHGMDLRATLNKNLPQGPLGPTRLPHLAFLELPFTILVDTVRLQDGSINYRERSDLTGLWGEIRFAALQGAFSGLRNVEVIANQGSVIDARIECLFMDTAILRANYNAPLDGNDAFSFTATLTDLPCTSLNQVTSNLLRLSLVKGSIEHLHLVMNGDNERAKGSMELAYSDLVTTVAANASRTQRRHMLGSIMDHILTPDMGGGLSDHRRRSVSIDRDLDRSLFTYIWHFTRTGIKRDIAPGVKERIGTLLRGEHKRQRDR